MLLILVVAPASAGWRQPTMLLEPGESFTHIAPYEDAEMLMVGYHGTAVPGKNGHAANWEPQYLDPCPAGELQYVTVTNIRERQIEIKWYWDPKQVFVRGIDTYVGYEFGCIGE